MDIIYTNENKRLITEKKLEKINELIESDEILVKYGVSTQTKPIDKQHIIPFAFIRCQLYKIDNNFYSNEGDMVEEGYITPKIDYVSLLHDKKYSKKLRGNDSEWTLLKEHVGKISKKLNENIETEKITNVLHKVENELKYRIRRAFENKDLVVSAKTGHLWLDYLLEFVIKDEYCGEMDKLTIQTFDDDHSITVHYGTERIRSQEPINDNDVDKSKYVIFSDKELRSEITEYFRKRGEEKWM